MTHLAGLAMFALLVNQVFVAAFGYPLVFCAGLALMTPLVGFFSVLQTLSTWGLVGAILFGKWKVAGAIFIVVFILQYGGSLFSVALFGHLCH